MNRLKVTYNKVMRRMMGLPPWCSGSARYRVRSFRVVMRIMTYGLLERVENSENMIILSSNDSDASVWSRIRAAWIGHLAIR